MLPTLILIALTLIVALVVFLPAASTLTATVSPTLSVVEVLGDTDDPFVNASAKSVTHGALASLLSKVMTAATSPGPPVTLQGFDKLAMSAGAASIDFRAFAGVAGGIKDANGLKLQAILFYAPTANANVVTLAEGASNGYSAFGASFTFKLQPGQWCLWFLNEAAPDIAAADKTIDITGTGSQEIWWHGVMG